MAKRERKATRRTRAADVKMAAANDVQEQPIAEPQATVEAPPPVTAAAVSVPRSTSPTGLGAYYAGLAGRPPKPRVIYTFGKTGYALSWQARAVRLGTTPEDLCARFKADHEQVKRDWEVLTAKKAQA